jgi:azurin/glucose/arabinose dehydrogenase
MIPLPPTAAAVLAATLLVAASPPHPARAVAPLAADTARVPVTENDFYRLVTVPIPEGVVLEVGGLATLPDGRLAVATRRGEVWTVENPGATGAVRPHFARFAHGLHEPLGLLFRDGALYTAQRGEMTRLSDTDGDGRADRYETVYRWPLSGNYHEYSFGPVLSPRGTLITTLNLAWIGRGASLAPWRGWTLELTPDGQMTPLATGMRSPAGFGYNLEGDLFYAENQGDWIASGWITHIERGDFVGNPEGLRWTDEPGSPLRLRPEDVPSTGEPMFEVARRVPGLKTPAVWFPHGIMGISTSDILVDSTGGGFGPFHGQLFVGDQGQSKIMRVALERVDGVYQGAVFPFREGFASGVLRQVWGSDGSMYVGMTSRGWGSTGSAPYALQRLVWTGRVPFVPHRIEARPDGFEVVFTQPVDRVAASRPGAYVVSGFTYRYHKEYGSPAINQEQHPVRHVAVSEDGLRARLVVDGVRQGYIHEIRMAGVRAADGTPLLHDVGYYTLNRIPAGHRLALPSAPAATPARTAAPAAAPAPRAGAAPTPAASAALAKRQTGMPAAWNGRADVTVSIGTRPGLQFSTTRFDVRAGSRVRLVFNNSDDMLHNLVVVRPGTADAVGQAALALGLQGQRLEYVPPSASVIAHTRVLGPAESESIHFVAPTEPGDYPFLCTFPGHYILMRGIMRVVP